MKNKNYYEAAIIHAIVDNFTRLGVKAKQIAIVTTTFQQ